MTGKLSVGMAFRRAGLLTTPEERKRPSVVERTAEILAATGGSPDEPGNGLALLYEDADLQAAHESLKASKALRRRGDITPDWALAEAKLDDAESVDQALAGYSRRR